MTAHSAPGSGSVALQDRFPAEFAHCFICGPANPFGFQLASHRDGDVVIARFVPPAWYTGGTLDVIPGGLVASLLDCHTAVAAAVAHAERLGWTDADPLPTVATARLEVDFRAPTPIRVDLLLEARVREIDGRKAWVEGTLLADGIPRAHALALVIGGRPPG